jgi:hypothetical protein
MGTINAYRDAYRNARLWNKSIRWSLRYAETIVSRERAQSQRSSVMVGSVMRRSLNLWAANGQPSLPIPVAAGGRTRTRTRGNGSAF